MSEVVADVARRFNARRSGKGYIAKCPAHDDRKPSLSIDEGVDGRARFVLAIDRRRSAVDNENSLRPLPFQFQPISVLSLM